MYVCIAFAYLRVYALACSLASPYPPPVQQCGQNNSERNESKRMQPTELFEPQLEPNQAEPYQRKLFKLKMKK